MPIILSCLRMEVRFFFVIDIEMIVAYACDIKCVYVCEFRGRNSSFGGVWGMKNLRKINFFKGQNGNLSL